MFRIPDSGCKRALCVVDVQPAFINKNDNAIINNIVNLIKHTHYDCYIESLFSCDDTSLWIKQANDLVVPKDVNFKTVSEISEILKSKDPIRLEKESKSVFKGNIPLTKILNNRNISEIHFVGYDVDDCVLVSAEEAFDLGFFSYVIEECTGSSSGNSLKNHALAVLQNVSLTNNSCKETIPFLELE